MCLLREGGSIVGGADVRNAVTGAALTEYFNEYKCIGRASCRPTRCGCTSATWPAAMC